MPRPSKPRQKFEMTDAPYAERDTFLKQGWEPLGVAVVEGVVTAYFVRDYKAPKPADDDDEPDAD